MIIVSQDKKCRVIIDNVTSIWIEEPEENDSEQFSIEVSAEIDECLGYYETEERALEVLEELTEFYDRVKRKSINAIGNNGQIFRDRFYFEMPKE